METAKIENSFLAGIHTKEDWLAKKDNYRARLFSMLGIDPKRERTDLKAKITGKVEGEGFVVEKLHYQSSPGLYVTGNLYLPEERKPNEKIPRHSLRMRSRSELRREASATATRYTTITMEHGSPETVTFASPSTPSSSARSRVCTTAFIPRTCGGGLHEDTPPPA